MDVALAAGRGVSLVGLAPHHDSVVIDETPTIEDVLTAWSDASLAAELARRLARAGDAAVGDPEWAAVPEVESLVESTVKDASETAAIAKGTGDRLQGARGAMSRQDAARGEDGNVPGLPPFGDQARGATMPGPNKP